MSNFIIENRKLYLQILSNHLNPLIYQGFESIYEDADKISSNNNVLKNFQIFLKKIPNWSPEILENEKNRILANLTDSEYIFNLIKLIIKYTMIQLTLNKGKLLLKDDSFFKDINFKSILHTIYIESAREIYLNPFLFYNKLPSVEIKKNQNMVLDIIKDKIEKVILELIPLDEIVFRNLQVPLDDYENITPILNNNPNPSLQLGGNDISDNNLNLTNFEKESKTKDYSEKFISASKMPKESSTQDEILNIINEVKKDNQPKNLSDISDTSEEEQPKDEPEKVINIGGGSKENSSDGLKRIMNELKDSNLSETSISFVPPSENDNDNGVAEVFTNNKKDSPSKKLNKNKYFTNYLKV